jgi:HAD superfamily hydrolase (TIGR01509 family)
MMEHAFPPMAALVERLHEAATPLYLLSNAPALVGAWLRGPGRLQHPFLSRFRDYVVSGRVGCAKPDAAIYDLVCRSGDFHPSDAVLIDDVVLNIGGARAFGMYGIHHRSPDGTAAALRELGLPA